MRKKINVEGFHLWYHLSWHNNSSFYMIASASAAPHLITPQMLSVAPEYFKHPLQPLFVMLLWYSSHMLFFFPSWMNIFLWVTPTPGLYNVMPLVTCLSPVGFLNLIFQLPSCTLQSPASLFSFSPAPICPPLVRTYSLLLQSVSSCSLTGQILVKCIHTEFLASYSQCVLKLFCVLLVTIPRFTQRLLHSVIHWSLK